MRTLSILVTGLIACAPAVGAAQVRLDPEWMVQFTPGAPAATEPPPTPAVAEEELLRLVAAEQAHFAAWGRFTAQLADLEAYERNPGVAIHLTAGPDWLVALAVGGQGPPIQVTVWRRSAPVETVRSTTGRTAPVQRK